MFREAPNPLEGAGRKATLKILVGDLACNNRTFGVNEKRQEANPSRQSDRASGQDLVLK